MSTVGRPPTLLEAVHVTLRRLHYSPRTEEAYIGWIRAFIHFHGRRHPREMGAEEVTAFLNFLAVEKKVAASTQNQALCAIVFLYKYVLELDLEWLEGLTRAQRPRRLPVLARAEVDAVLDRLDRPIDLLGEIFYGSGLRLMEGISLRVKDIDFARHQIMVRDGKGEVDSAVPLARRSEEKLHGQMELVAKRHHGEVRAGRGEVDLPSALVRKFPNASRSLPWQYLFPAYRHSHHPGSPRPQGRTHDHDLHPSRRPGPARSEESFRPREGQLRSLSGA